MKPRKVVVTLELETSATIKDLKNKESWVRSYGFPSIFMVIKQVQVNVVKGKKG